MSTEQNKALIRRGFEEFVNRKNLAPVDELIAPNFVGYYSGVPEPVRGREGFKQLISMYHSAFPDLKVTIDDMIAEGDKVAVRLNFRGTHQGELMGIPPTGKPIALTAINIFRVEGGKAAEQRVNSDDLGMLQQLGVIPPPG
jgi:steroid delta-isomerase-like uncharacterized protein